LNNGCLNSFKDKMGWFVALPIWGTLSAIASDRREKDKHEDTN